MLAFIAGIVNVVGILGFDHHPITHLTGTTSLLGESLARFDGPAAGHLLALIGSFLAGTVFCAFLIGDIPLRLGRRYGVALLLESLLLFGSVPLLWRENILGIYGAAFAVGLQNAMVSTCSGAVVRTTHVSGMFTDLGIFLGHMLRGLPVDRWRGRLCFLVVTGFLCGGIAGTWLFRAAGYTALCVPGTLTALAALANAFYPGRAGDVHTAENRHITP